MTTIDIPAECVAILRSSLLSQIGIPAGQVEEASMTHEKENHPEWFRVPLAEIDEHRAVVDRLGWADRDTEESVSLDLGAHRNVIVKALHTRLEVERDYMQIDDVRGVQEQYATAALNSRVIEGFLNAHGLMDGE
jgi:hypothetical protein